MTDQQIFTRMEQIIALDMIQDKKLNAEYDILRNELILRHSRCKCGKVAEMNWSQRYYLSNRLIVPTLYCPKCKENILEFDP